MNRLALLTCAAAVATVALSLSTPLASQDIVVSPTDDGVAHFVRTVSQQIDRNLARAVLPPRAEPHGIVRLQFEVDGTGRASNVSFYSRSGDQVADRAAMRAVQRLGRYDPIPHEFVANRQVQANIIFASSEAEYLRQAKVLARDEAVRIASDPAERRVLALTTLAGSHS
ncbi:MAG: energy transducer TonB family protein [Erythrobacter sp.]